jgi:hypothetical protein
VARLVECKVELGREWVAEWIARRH